MGRTLAKPWNRAAPGTVITTETEEAYKTGALLVDPARFSHLEAEGFFESVAEVEMAEESTEQSAPPMSTTSSGKEEASADPVGANVPETAEKSTEAEATFPTTPPPVPPARKVAR